MTDTYGTSKPLHPTYNKGMRDIIAGDTTVSTVGDGPLGLRFRGYEVVELARHCVFEEVLYFSYIQISQTRQSLISFPRRCGL